MSRVETELADPYRVVYGQDDYHVQNMQIRSHKYPVAHQKDQDMRGRAWSDHQHADWDRGRKLIAREGINFIAAMRSAPAEDFLAFCQEFAPKDWVVTGGRVVRYTNVANLFPTYAIDFFVKHPDTPNEPLDQVKPPIRLTDVADGHVIVNGRIMDRATGEIMYDW